MSYECRKGKENKTCKEINSLAQHIRTQTLAMGYKKAEVRRVPVTNG